MRKAPTIILGIKSHVMSVDATSGNELWRTKLKSSQFVTVYQRRDRIFAGAAGELFCLDTSGGSILWHNKLKGLGYGIVGFAADRGRSEKDLIIGIKGRIVSIDPWSGKERWRSQPLGSGGDSVTLLTLGARHVIAGHYGEVYCVDRTSGKVLWNNRLKGLGFGLVTMGGNETAMAHTIAQAQAAAAGAAAAASAAS
jgi:outer membrane protein assembly factor BamB